MSSERLPMVAAIPNYNMAPSLGPLLSQVLASGYDEAYVLDDHSSDSSKEVVAAFGSDVGFVDGSSTVGPGANRNRILEALDGEATIHFLDADVQLLTQQNPDLIRASLEEHPDVGAVGGLIQLPDGTPWMFNYGPRYSIYSNLAGWAQALAHDTRDHPLRRRIVDRISGWRHNDFPDISELPATKQVFWVGEANFWIPSQVFEAVGGFDPELPYHDAQDLGFKLDARGFETWFDPRVAVAHPPIDNNAPERREAQVAADKMIIRKYGIHLK